MSMSNDKKKLIFKKDLKKNKFKVGQSSKLVDQIMKLRLPYKMQTRKNYKAKFSIIKIFKK